MKRLVLALALAVATWPLACIEAPEDREPRSPRRGPDVDYQWLRTHRLPEARAYVLLYDTLTQARANLVEHQNELDTDATRIAAELAEPLAPHESVAALRQAADESGAAYHTLAKLQRLAYVLLLADAAAEFAEDGAEWLVRWDETTLLLSREQQRSPLEARHFGRETPAGNLIRATQRYLADVEAWQPPRDEPAQADDRALQAAFDHVRAAE